VVIADLQEDKGNELADQIGGAFCKVNVTETDDIVNAVEMAKSMGPVRVLVNSAGIGWAQRTVGKDGTLDSAADLDAFKRVISINLIGTFDCIRVVGTAISTSEPLEYGERGAIVNIASVAAFDGQIGQASYSASKGGVVGMTLPIARDLSAIGIRINTVAPGLIDTPIYGEGDASEAFKENLQKGVLFPKRLGDPEQLASMVIECITNSYMTKVALDARLLRCEGSSLPRGSFLSSRLALGPPSPLWSHPKSEMVRCEGSSLPRGSFLSSRLALGPPSPLWNDPNSLRECNGV